MFINTYSKWWKYPLCLILGLTMLQTTAVYGDRGTEVIRLGGPSQPIEIRVTSDGLPYIKAKSDPDAAFALGYYEARDHFWAMDLNRRAVEGTVAELLGPAALGDDGFFLTLGADRLAQGYLDLVSADERQRIEAYAAGINAYILNPENPLPVEYSQLELTRASIRPWTPLDCGRVGALIVAGLAISGSDINNTLALQAFVGAAGPSQGAALYFGDLFRYAPIDPDAVATTPGALPPMAQLRTQSLSHQNLARAAAKLDRVRNRVREMTMAEASNWIAVSGTKTESGLPIIAHDPHLGLTTPSIWYEVGIEVKGDYSVRGFTLPGIGGIIASGHNGHVSWGGTNSTTDLTDIYLETFGPPTAQGVPTVIFEGQAEPVEVEQRVLKANIFPNGSSDTVVPIAPVTILRTARHGPIIQLLDGNTAAGSQALALRAAALEADTTLDAFSKILRAKTVEEGMQILGKARSTVQNYALADTSGTIGYITVASVPLREDMEAGLVVPGLTPDFIRDGSHTLPHEWLPNAGTDDPRSFAVIPIEQMPQEVNPARGYLVNSNNDQLGLTADGDPFNTARPGGGIYYLGTRFSEGRISRLIPLMEEKLLASGEKLTLQDVQSMQNDQVIRSGQLLTPFIVEALDNAQDPSAAPELQQLLAANPNLAPAVEVLRSWDGSTPTGIAEGYDIGDSPDNLPQPSMNEINHSVATTIYHMWSDAVCQNVVIDTLNAIGVVGFNSCPSRDTAKGLLALLENFDTNQGLGVSGVDFFQQGVPPGLSAGERRDYLLLKSVADGLDRLSSAEFAAEYGMSTNVMDYRWGRVHRLRIPHALEPISSLLSVPPQGSTMDLAPDLPGTPFGGASDTINVSPSSLFNINSPSSLLTSFGVSHRRLVEVTPGGLDEQNILPPGNSGLIDSENYADQMPRYLVGELKNVPDSRPEVAQDTAKRILLVPDRSGKKK